MNRIVIAIGLLASTLAGKEALAQPVIPSAPTQVTVPANEAPYERGDVYGGGYDNRYGNGNGNGYGNGYGYRRGHDQNRWSYLAAVDVTGRDRDVIALGPQAGRYDRLMLVPQGRVWLRHAIVTFMNGETMSVDLRSAAYNRDGSVVIDLPGERRAVSTVQLFAAGRRWGGGAQVALYGERGFRRGGWWR